MAVQQKSMGSAWGTKAVGHNSGGYDGDITSRIVLGLWRNTSNRVETVAKYQIYLEIFQLSNIFLFYKISNNYLKTIYFKDYYLFYKTSNNYFKKYISKTII